MIYTKYGLVAIYALIPLFFLLNFNRKQVGRGERYLIYVFLTLFVGMRSTTIGADTLMYEQSFNMNLFLTTEAYEFSWIAICYIVKFVLHGSFHLVLMIYAILSVIPVVFMCFHHSKRPYLSLLLYVLFGYYFLSFNIIRQTAAIGISLLSLDYFQKKRIGISLAFFVAALLLHKTAIFAPLSYYMAFVIRRINRQQLVILLIFTLFFGVVFSNYLNTIISQLEIGKYQSYSDYANEKGANIIGLFFTNTVASFTCIWLILSSRNSSLYFKIYVLSVILFNLIGYNIGMNRVYYYASFLSIIAIPNSIFESRLNRRKLMMERASSRGYYRHRIFAIVVFVYSILYVRSIIDNMNGIYPF